jgi:muconolactone delta-isomerase
MMEFLVEFEIAVPEGTPAAEVADRERAEAAAAAKLADEGHILRVWKRSVATGQTRVLGLYRADSRTELDDMLGHLPLGEWMRVTVTPLQPHPNDPATESSPPQGRGSKDDLPVPNLSMIYRLEATLGEPLDLGETAQGRRRVVALTGGRFEGPDIRGRLVPGASADWQTVLPDGTALADLRYTLETEEGALLSVQGHGVRHGSAEVLARLARGEDVDASEYTFRVIARIETGDPQLSWLNKGVFACVGGRRPGTVIYETYLVG